MSGMHEIDYKLFGEDLQYVEIELDPMEAVVSEAGAMMYMEAGIEMETIFGDGSQKQSGFMGALMGAGKRLLTGESLFMTVFQNRGNQRQKVAFGAPYPGRIVPIHLQELGGELIAQKDSFLCAAKGVSVGIAFNKKIGVGLFGGEGFIMERLQGDGWRRDDSFCFGHNDLLRCGRIGRRKCHHVVHYFDQFNTTRWAVGRGNGICADRYGNCTNNCAYQ